MAILSSHLRIAFLICTPAVLSTTETSPPPPPLQSATEMELPETPCIRVAEVRAWVAVGPLAASKVHSTAAKLDTFAIIVPTDSLPGGGTRYLWSTGVPRLVITCTCVYVFGKILRSMDRVQTYLKARVHIDMSLLSLRLVSTQLLLPSRDGMGLRLCGIPSVLPPDSDTLRVNMYYM